MKKILLFLIILFLVLSRPIVLGQQVIDNDLILGTYTVENGYGKKLLFRGNAWNNSSTWLASTLQEIT